MIYFRDYHWLTVHGYTCFDALINADARKADDVFWMLALRCRAGAPTYISTPPACK